MNKLYALLLVSFLSSGAATVVEAQTGYRIKSTTGANLRGGPGTSHGTIASIPSGAKVRVVEKGNDGWYKVEYNGQTGYVSRELIENNDDQHTAQSQSAPSRNSNSTQSGSSQTSNQNQQRSSNERSSNERNDRTASKQGRSNSASRNRSGGGVSSSRNWGIGLRLGEPAGLTVKQYLSNNHALEVSLGRSARWGYYYDEDDFYKMDKYQDRDYYRYGGYKGGFSTALQVHYLWQKPIASAKGLDWYLGVGGQARFTPVRYYYYYNDGTWDNDWQKWYYVEERRTDIDLGLDGVVGLEYTLPSAPISIFADVNLFLEIVDAPFFAAGQGGVGVRYNF